MQEFVIHVSGPERAAWVVALGGRSEGVLLVPPGAPSGSCDATAYCGAESNDFFDLCHFLLRHPPGTRELSCVVVRLSYQAL